MAEVAPTKPPVIRVLPLVLPVDGGAAVPAAAPAKDQNEPTIVGRGVSRRTTSSASGGAAATRDRNSIDGVTGGAAALHVSWKVWVNWEDTSEMTVRRTIDDLLCVRRREGVGRYFAAIARAVVASDGVGAESGEVGRVRLS
jgi:hypothetical protein